MIKTENTSKIKNIKNKKKRITLNYIIQKTIEKIKSNKINEITMKKLKIKKLKTMRYLHREQ